MTRAQQQRYRRVARDASSSPPAPGPLDDSSFRGRTVAALMTPIASPEVFAAALRYQLHGEGGARILQGAGQGVDQSSVNLALYLQPDRPPAVRAVAASFILNQARNTDALPGILAAAQGLRPPAEQQLRQMLTHVALEERQAASQALLDLADLTPFQAQVSRLLEDSANAVCQPAFQAIAQTRCRRLYPQLLKALQSPHTEQLARETLLSLGQDAIAVLQRCTQHPGVSLPTKMTCWKLMAALPGPRSHLALAEDVMHQTGAARHLLLKLMVSLAQGSAGIGEHLSQWESLGQLIREELWLLGHLYAALTDLSPSQLPGGTATQLAEALRQQQRDVGERLLLLLQLRHPDAGLARVALLLHNPATLEIGLSQLGQVVEPTLRHLIIAVFDASSARQKRLALADWADGASLPPAERLQKMLSLHLALEPWPLACAYELALEQKVPLSDEALLQGIHHDDAAVRGAVQAYLNRMSPALVEALLLGAGANEC